MDAVFYQQDALRLFCWKSLHEVQEITFEIGIQGQHGLDINDRRKTRRLERAAGEGFSALELLCIMHAGFKQIEPGMDIGVDLGEEGGWRRG